MRRAWTTAALFRYPPDYRVAELKTALDWSAYPGAGGGFQGAVEMCNNNGACRKLEGGVMCPSYRATRNEKDVTRGRANTLRLAISGQLGADALTSDEMMDALKLCVSCKACRHECPTGVDMAKMKIEVLAARVAKHGLSLRDRLVGYPAPLCGARRALRPARQSSQQEPPAAKAARERSPASAPGATLPEWRRDVFEADAEAVGPADGREVVLFADTFNRAYERENLDAALRVLVEGGYRVHLPRAGGSQAAPLCCGRTFLSAGLVDHARAELDRLVTTYAPFAARGVPIIGLEPSCLLTLRDELLSLRIGRRRQDHQRACAAVRGISGARGRGRPPQPAARARRRERPCCTATATRNRSARSSRSSRCCGWFPALNVETIELSCCGMAGAFGYGAETYQASMEMAELSLLPAVRRADDAR